jgi:hypothetical protein
MVLREGPPNDAAHQPAAAALLLQQQHVMGTCGYLLLTAKISTCCPSSSSGSGWPRGRHQGSSLLLSRAPWLLGLQQQLQLQLARTLYSSSSSKMRELFSLKIPWQLTKMT